MKQNALAEESTEVVHVIISDWVKINGAGGGALKYVHARKLQYFVRTISYRYIGSGRSLKGI